jgi:alkanesulfonate monooxygenase SsuD/methylene tetrahydromethanopterin reductase-like flavin-dependent oxidoreductase (luciferase family)
VEAERLASSLEQAFVLLRRGRPGPLPRPRDGFRAELAPDERALLEETLSCSFVGTPAAVARRLEDFVARTGADELIVAAHIHDHTARLRSYELTSTLR